MAQTINSAVGSPMVLDCALEDTFHLLGGFGP